MTESELRDRAERVLVRVGVASDGHADWVARAIPVFRAEAGHIDIAKIADALTDVAGAHAETVEKAIILGIAIALSVEASA